MSNTNTVIDMVAKEALRLAHEKATFLGTVNRDYDDSFAKSGAKIGSTLRVRNPNAYTRRTGSRVMNVQDTTETTQTITVATQDGVDLRWNSAELTLDIDELSKRYIDPAMSVLVSGMESDHLTTATKAVYNTVGTAGTVVGTNGDISALGQARAKLNQGLAPAGERNVQMDSVTMASITNGIKGLFLPRGELERAWREGYIGQTQMAAFFENERTWAVSNSDDVTANTNADGLVTDGGSTIAVGDDLAQAKQVVGSVFTVAGVYACHYETKQSLGHLQQFTVTATGAVNVTVSPTIYLTGPKQNVSSAASAQLAVTAFNEAALTFHGAASAVLRQNLMYHKDAFTFVTADLPLMDDAHKCVRMQKDGISLRVWQASDIRNDELLLRIDILHGFKVLRPEWACRISN
jgi:hypothetical protein